MNLFERFKDTCEEGFREEFVKPLLIRMGFVGISNKHGSQEFGKDYVFSELSPFGDLRHMVVQAKHEASINQGRKVDDLLSQIRQCFYVDYKLPSSPSDSRRASSVYVFNSGDITENAAKYIRAALPKEHATNTHIFDGHRREVLSRTVVQRSTASIRNRLEGLRGQLSLNFKILENIPHGVRPGRPLEEQQMDPRVGLFAAVESFLTEPIQWGNIGYETMIYFWQRLKAVEFLTRAYSGTIVRPTVEALEREMKTLIMFAQEAAELARVLIVQCTEAIETLPSPVI